MLLKKGEEPKQKVRGWTKVDHLTLRNEADLMRSSVKFCRGGEARSACGEGTGASEPR